MRTFKIFLCAAAIACFAAGCSDSDSDSNHDTIPGNSKAAVDVQMTETALTAADVPAVDNAKAQKWGDELNAFGIDFMHKLDMKSNLVFSPFSLHSALSMAACGANGDTLKEMAEVLHVSNDVTEIAKDNGAMRLNLRYDGQTEGSQFAIANRIWVDQSSEVVPEFKTLMTEQFKAPLQIVSFQKYADDVMNIINEWVSNITNGMIKELISPGIITSDTRMVLVNAIHFDGKWENKFETENTHDREFLVNGTQAKDIPMMNQVATINYFENSDYKAIVMPYEGNKFSMIFILPLENDKLPQIVANLSETDISGIMKDSNKESVAILLPKFKIETDLHANKVLQAQGMILALDDEAADFSKMISNQGIFIKYVIHKAVIDVDEEGTKAAAATAVIAEQRGSDFEGRVFHADHPFAFALVHNASNGIMFAGQYVGE